MPSTIKNRIDYGSKSQEPNKEQHFHIASSAATQIVLLAK